MFVLVLFVMSLEPKLILVQLPLANDEDKTQPLLFTSWKLGHAADNRGTALKVQGGMFGVHCV